MRWDLLFADLEAQAIALESAELAGEIDERTRIELARLTLADRLGGAVGRSVRVRGPAGISAAGPLVRIGTQWLLIDEGDGRQALVALAAVRSVTGIGRLTTAPTAAGAGGYVESRLGLAHVLRGIARDRSAVRIELHDGAVLEGTIDRVGADYLELALHSAGEPRRREEVRDVAVLALGAIAVVRRGAG